MVRDDRVLIVDDDESNRRMISRVLERVGYECAMAKSSQEALHLLSEDAFGLVLTDLRMAGDDGVDLIREIADRYPSVRSILVTGLVEAGLDRRVRDAGGFAVVSKPVDINALCEVVGSAFSERDGR